MGCKHVFAFCAVLFAWITNLSATAPAAQASSSSSSQISLIQTANTEGAGVSSLSQSFSSANQFGNLLIAFVRMSSTSQTVQVSDSSGNAYREAVSQVQNDDGHQIHMFYAANVASGMNTVTATFSAVNNHPWLAIFEYSGVATANPLDATSSAQGSGTAVSAGNPVETRAGNKLVFAGVGLPSSSSATISAGDGFNLESQNTNVPGSRGSAEDQITSSTEPLAGAFSLSASANWTAAVATFSSAQLTVTTTSLPEATQGVPYNATAAASGGVEPYSWTVTSALPPGLSISRAGVISGTPTSAGSYTVTVQVTDAVGNTASQPLQIQVNSAEAIPISLVQSASVTGTAVSMLSQSFPNANTFGNLIVAFVRMSTTSQTVQLTDTQGNLYKDAVSQPQSIDGHQTHIFYAANVAAGANTVTATFSGTNNHPWLAIYEYSGLDSMAPLDKTAHAEGSSSSPNSGATQTTSSARELVFAGIGLPATSSQTITAGVGFTLLQQDAPPDTSRAANQQAIVNAAGSYTSSSALSGLANWTSALATFQASAPAHAQLTANPASVDFGSVPSGTSGTQSITISNIGMAAALITQFTQRGAGFAVTGLNVPLSLPPNATLTFTVTFTPSSPGPYSGTVTLTSDATNSPLNIGLSGTATQPAQGQITANPSSVNFGSVNTGSTSSQTVTLGNTGNADVSITQISSSGNGFVVNGPAMPYALTVGNTVALSVDFAPTTTTSYSGVVTITSNAATSQVTIPLSGSGTQPSQGQLSPSPSGVNFGTISAGTASMQSLILRNSGTAAANITQISASGIGFSVVGAFPPYSLASGASVSLQITFSPDSAGIYSGAVAVASDASNGSLFVPLSGTATHSVSLRWTDGQVEIAGYNIYRAGQSGGPYTKLNGSLIPSQTWLDTSIQAGATYYYVLTAVGISGMESVYSAESLAVIPNP